MSLRDQVVVLTGAANGIGEQMAYQLARQGARLVLADRDGDRLEATARACRAHAEAVPVQGDLRDEATCRELMRRAIESFGRLDVLINNAGITMLAPFRDLADLEAFRRVLDVNFWASVYCTHAALPYLITTGGRLVFVSSVAGLTGVPLRTAYSASKHALTGFAESLRIELLDTRVSITIVFPDYVATDLRVRGLDAKGQLLGRDPVKVQKPLSAEACAARILSAAEARKRQDILSLRGRAGVWLKAAMPALLDRIARKNA